MKIKIMFLVMILGVGITEATGTGTEKKYLKIGADPTNPEYILQEGERLISLKEDISVRCKGGSGKTYQGWLRKGEVVVCSADNRVIRIYRCGNPVLDNIVVAKTIDTTTITTAPPAPTPVPALAPTAVITPSTTTKSPSSYGKFVALGFGATLLYMLLQGGSDGGGGGGGGTPPGPPPDPPN